MDDLIGEFIAETMESLSTLDQELVKFEQNPNDDAILGNIFRLVHTIKGTCGFLGLSRLENVAHASENVLGKIRDGKLEATPHAITLVLTSLDCIKGLVEYLNANGKEGEGDDSDLIDKLNEFAETGAIGTTPSPVAVENPPAELASFFKGDDELNELIAQEKTEREFAEPLTSFFKGDAELEALMAQEKAAAIPSPKPPADKGPPIAEKGEGAGMTNQSIRVNIDVLESLMQMVSELVLTRNQLTQLSRVHEDKHFVSPIQQLSHITTELQEGIMKTRMQPIGNAWSKFPRLVRDLSNELDKKIELVMKGAETELDRQLLEMIKDPLTHMVRNSCDHGLETTEGRIAAGKPESGTVTLSAYHEGGHIIIDIADDGKGIDVARVRDKAISNGLISATEAGRLSDQQIMQFIFRAGFSTAEKVTAVSGRGVGMDVVRTNIEKIGGAINLTSQMGKGSKFSIKIPLTLAIVPVLIVESSGNKFAIPQLNVLELVRASANSEYKIESINGAPVMRLREKLLPLRQLSDILQMETAQTQWEGREAFITVCRVGGYDFGLIVDRIYDTEEIVVKPVAQALKSIPVYSGNTILGDGSVIMILDPNGIARMVGNIGLGERQQEPETVLKAALQNQPQLVSYLLFTVGRGAPKAVPLELVARLEEIDVRNIEVAGIQPVVQYRGELMPLIALEDDLAIPSAGMAQVIVFTYDKKTVGLVVETILDIVEAPYDVKLNSMQKPRNYLGSTVIAGKTTDLVDVACILANVFECDEEVPAPPEQISERRNVLFVEDSPFFRSLTEPFLTSAGYNITSAEDGSEALQLLNKNPSGYDLIVTDIEMPSMNGYDLSTACRSQASFAELPIIAYTATMSQEVVRKAKAAGIDECIVKTDRPGLLEAISYCLHNGRAAA